MSGYEVFALGDLPLQCGPTLTQARLACKSYGEPAKDRANVILYPISYGAQHGDPEWLIGPGRVLDATRRLVVVPNMFTNGLSTSPSKRVPELRYGRWPQPTHVDHVAAQRRLLRAMSGLESLALAAVSH